jgi:flagellar protein FlaG
MTDIVGNAGASPDPTYGSKSQTVTQPAQTAVPPPQPAGPNPVDLRLVIEDDQQAGCFVYKTIDWVTGQVVQQFPREQILKMREGSDYTAGDVIRSQA